MKKTEFTTNNEATKNVLTVALRRAVAFPDIQMSFIAGRKATINAVRKAVESGEDVVFVAREDNERDIPTADSLFEIGSVGKVLRIFELENGNLDVVIEPQKRVRLLNVRYDKKREVFLSDFEVYEVEKSITPAKEIAFRNMLCDKFETFMNFTDDAPATIPEELFTKKSLRFTCDYIGSTFFKDFRTSRDILERYFVENAAKIILVELKNVIDSIDFERRIDTEVNEASNQNREEFYIRERIKALTNRLRRFDPTVDEISKYNAKIEESKIEDAEFKKELLAEVQKLKLMGVTSPEATVIRNYLDEVLAIPWGTFSKYNLNIERAKKILDADHFGLREVKDRFVELIAVLKNTTVKNPRIVCLVGPPGIGKTSIVKSLAESMGLEYVRLSLGGVHDEAEIRGHRKTYIGAMPGRIISALKRAKTMNPIILLDEVDKISKDGRGDPASALLEALDPARNFNFTDNFIAHGVDLSDVVFVTTANSLSGIPLPLLDRMEIIELPAYTDSEKTMIAKKHLLKKQMKLHGLTTKRLKLSRKMIEYIVDNYIYEPGVRTLERIIATICRKTLVKLESENLESLKITPELLSRWLEPPRTSDYKNRSEDAVGVVNALVVKGDGGGEVSLIEAVKLKGEGKMSFTGNISKVMEESAKIAFVLLKSKADELGISEDNLSVDIHAHAERGAVPKDGPSAGVALTTLFYSILTGKKIRHDVAMTGEISITGRVLPIGGLKEKSMGAYKRGIKKIVIPQDNLNDVQKCDEIVKKNVEFVPVKSVFEALKHTIAE